MHCPSLFTAALAISAPYLILAAPASDPVNGGSRLAKRYVGGQCGVHVVQHQKPNPATDPYIFDITVKDAAGNVIGGSQGQVGLAGQAINQASQLPYVVLITPGAVDADTVGFAYAASGFQCSFGGYDSGSRQIDCGFAC